MTTVKDKLSEELQKAIKKSRWDKAISALDKLARIEPENPLYHLRQGDYYLKLDLKDKSVQEYYTAARIYTEGGFIVKALAVYKMILRADPEDHLAEEKMQALHAVAQVQTDPRRRVSGPWDLAWAATAIPLFAHLTQAEFNEVVGRMLELQFSAGDRIIQEGEKGDSIFIVSRGAVRVMTRVAGKEVLLAELKENDFFGEVGYLTGRPRTADVVAATEAELLELKGTDMAEVNRRYPHVRRLLEEFHELRVKGTIEKLKDRHGLL